MRRISASRGPFSRSKLPTHGDTRPVFAVSMTIFKEMTMPIGTVKFFNADKGYGFIQPEGSGNDAFVHISAVEKAGMRTLERDQRISYELETDARGKTSACNL